MSSARDQRVGSSPAFAALVAQQQDARMHLLPRRRAAHVRQRLQALALLILEPQPVYLAWHLEHSLSSAIAAQAYGG